MIQTNEPGKWWAAGNAWLIKKAGAGWRKNRYENPYRFGYSQPVWMDMAREALGRNDEEGFKAIKLENL